MPYFLDLLGAMTNLSTWITVLIIVFIVIPIIYSIVAYRQEKFVVATSVATTNIGPVTADQLYYLPTASLAINATARVAISTDPSGKILSARLISLKLENKVTIEPDTSTLYLLQYKPSIFGNDELRINTNAAGLLETIEATTEDSLPAIIAELSNSPQKILSGFQTKGIRKGFDWQPEIASGGPVTIQTVEFVNNFVIHADELLATEITRSWIISIDGIQINPVTVDASFKLKKDSIVPKHYTGTAPLHGIITRPLRTVKIEMTVDNAQFNMASPQVYNIMVPDVMQLINVPITRTALVKMVQTPKFSNGMLVENYINKPSQAEAFFSIPVNMLKAIFSIPAQLLSFRIFHLQKEAELEKAARALANAKAETAKTEAVQQQLNNSTSDLKEATDKLNEKAKEFTDELKKAVQGKKPANESIEGVILIEAIEAHDEEWKARYNVLDISVGKKKVNGFETSINALVFKPVDKLEAGKNEFEPVPAFIPFKASDGKEYYIPTDVQRTGGPIEAAFTPTPNEACDANTPKRPGCSVSRLNNEDTGTIGLKVFKDGQSFVLSCYHVLCSSELRKNIFEFDPVQPAGGDSTIISPGLKDQGNSNDVLGKVVEGKLNKFLDCAIAKLDDDLDVKSRICRIDQEPGKTIVIGTEHLQPRLRVYMSGRTSKFQNAHIKSPYTSTDIEYSIGKITLKGLIATSPLAQQGDSGAVVFDEECNVVGIVVARSPSDTYILPIKRILHEFQVQLKP